MEEINKVTVFVGNFSTENDLSKYIKEHFTEDGDIYSDFMKDLDIDFIDNQFQEVLFLGKSISKNDFKEFSYSDNFIDFINEDLSNYNSLILLYNFNFNSNRKPAKVKLIGVYDYK